MDGRKHTIQLILFMVGIHALRSQDVVPDVVNGGWGEWHTLTLCSAKSCNCTGEVANITKCEPGTQVLVRHCDNPRPANGGKRCQGVPLRKTENCINLEGTCPGWCPWTKPKWKYNGQLKSCLWAEDRNASRHSFIRERKRRCECPRPIHDRDGDICKETSTSAKTARMAWKNDAGIWYQEEDLDATKDPVGFDAIPDCTTPLTTTPTTTTTTTTTMESTTAGEINYDDSGGDNGEGPSFEDPADLDDDSHDDDSDDDDSDDDVDIYDYLEIYDSR